MRHYSRCFAAWRHDRRVFVAAVLALEIAALTLPLTYSPSRTLRRQDASNTLPVLMFGQSNIANFWQNSNYALDLNTSTSSCAISSVMYAQFPDAILSAAPITGTNIPASDTYTTDSMGANLTLASCATGNTTSGTVDFQFPHIASTRGRGLRYQGGTSSNVYPVDDVPHADEGQYSVTSLRATYGYPGGADAFSNALATAYDTILEFQVAVGGTPICDWVSATTSTCTGPGSLYVASITSPSTGFGHNNMGVTGFRDAMYQQGEYEAINAPQTQAEYYENLQNLLAWVSAFPGAPPFVVAVMGNLVGISTDADANAVVQAELQMIDTGGGKFGGSMRTIPLGSDRHWTRTGLVTAACYMAQAILKANGNSNIGEGPRIDQAGVTYDGTNILSIPVIQETGTALRAANQSPSGIGITGFVVKDGGGSTVPYTSSFSGNTIRLAIGTQTTPITVAYMEGVNLDTSNPVYDNATLSGPDCTPGLPLQPSRGPFITASLAPTTGTVWLSPQDNQPRPGWPGSADFMDLFPPGAPWTTAQGYTKVFRINPQFAQGASDADLAALIAGLQLRNIPLALEFGLLTDPSKCGVIEGYCGEQTGAVVSRIQSLGGTLAYVRADQPLWFGHVVVGTSIAALAADIANQVATIHATFPHCVVGDSEPLPGMSAPGDWTDEIAAWQAAYQAATGIPWGFIHTEVVWPDATSRSQMTTVAAGSQAQGIRFGIIYDGDASAASNTAWTLGAEQFFAYIEQTFVPDDAALEAFNAAYTNLSLPESTAGTMTSLVLKYQAPETILSAVRNMSNFTGSLKSLGLAVAGATITATRLDTNVIYDTETTDGSGGFTVPLVPGAPGTAVEFDYAGDGTHRLSFVSVP